ncbi:DUF4238 domain-containing protein [Merismopedia glauca]|uniref:DUF4238 domain-containing protein n=1 Tax=Merismopedia glauca CCAP 1448/3 TaxID=1296344 RepID=A0A2T1C3U9_9CYAN|nr:DUF4238 domain-containing protein [Merismopedia glauca]PSB02894.1 hypothetical protein C7B64_11030 [Merismopedia glauca CCAP 1448/3]
MSGKNQHFIPQFLQRGFSISELNGKAFANNVKSKRKKEDQIWVFESGRKPYLTNVRNKGAERFFYGLENSALDTSITKAEHQYAKLVNRLRTHTSDALVHEPVIPELVVHLFVRTKNLRNSIKDASQLCIDMVQNNLRESSDFENFIIKYLDENPDFFEKEIKDKFTLSQQKAIRQYISDHPHIISQFLRNSISELHPIMLNSLEFVQSELPDMIKEAHIKSLSDSIAPQERVEKLRSLRWSVNIAPIGSYILGDAGSLHITSENRYEALLTAENNFNFDNVLLPISSQHLLIGSIDSQIGKLDMEAVNEASAATSQEFFIASQKTEREVKYAQQIGTNNSILSDEKLFRLESEIRKEWFSN